MKVLLIGGTGVISTSVTLRLIEMGWQVTLLNRGTRPLPPAMQGKVRLLTGDINDEAAGLSAFRRPDQAVYVYQHCVCLS